MPAYFESGFVVRVPAWHEQAIVLDEFPGREEAMELAGHAYTVVERSLLTIEGEEDGVYITDECPGWKALVNDGNDTILNVVRQSYEVIQNDVGWDLVDAIIGEGAQYETGITLHGGAVCVVTAWLDEPVTIPGDNSVTLPYLVTRWAHDGSGSLSTRSTNVRVVCANTDELAAAQARKLGTDFTFRHTKNVAKRIEDAKMAVRGLRVHHEAFIELSMELAKIKVTKAQRDLFVSEFLPMPPEALISERVKNNVDEARAQLRKLFEGPTIPEAHRLTAYGLRLAGIEYLDHLRGWRNHDTYVGRQLLRTEPAKAKLATLIQEVVKSS